MKRPIGLAGALCIAVSPLAVAQAPASGTATLLVPRSAGTLDLVDPGSGLLLASVPLDTAPRRVAVAPDGRLAAVLGCRETVSGPAAEVVVSLVGLDQPQELRRIELGKLPCPSSLTWTAADRVNLTPESPGSAIVIDTDSGQVLPANAAITVAPDTGELRHAAGVDAATVAAQRVLAEGGRLEDLAVSPVSPRAVCHACTPDR